MLDTKDYTKLLGTKSKTAYFIGLYVVGYNLLFVATVAWCIVQGLYVCFYHVWRIFMITLHTN